MEFGGQLYACRTGTDNANLEHYFSPRSALVAEAQVVSIK